MTTSPDVFPYDPDERRLEAMEDQSGFTRERAEIKLGKRVVAGTSEYPRYKTPKHPPHRSGSVRGFHDGEPRMSEEFPDMGPPSPQQPGINANGLDKVRPDEDEVRRRIMSKVQDMVPIDPDNVAKSEADRERKFNQLWRKYLDQNS